MKKLEYDEIKEIKKITRKLYDSIKALEERVNLNMETVSLFSEMAQSQQETIDGLTYLADMLISQLGRVYVELEELKGEPIEGKITLQ